MAHEPLDRRRRRAARAACGPARRCAAPELERTAGGVRLPERHLARFAGSRRDEHAIVGDLFDAPGRGAEEERLADAALEDHLFVELADARAGTALAEQEDAVEPAIRNRAAVDDGDTRFAPFARGEHVRRADPRSGAGAGRRSRRTDSGPTACRARPRTRRGLRSANGAARRTAANRSSTVQSSIATIATICCASTSSGLRG